MEADGEIGNIIFGRGIASIERRQRLHRGAPGRADAEADWPDPERVDVPHARQASPAATSSSIRAPIASVSDPIRS